MGRTIMAVGLALAILGAIAVVRVLRTSGGGRHATASRNAPDASVLGAGSTPAPAGGLADAPAPAGQGPAEPAAPASAPAAMRGAVTSGAGSARTSHVDRRLLRRLQVQEKLAARRKAGADAALAREQRLPPEERAAMEAAGLDWRKMQRMMRGEAPVEGGAGSEGGSRPEEER